MSKRLTYERFVWFDRRIRENRYPNNKHLVEEFEISERTARRDIEFMRYHLSAPLGYDRSRRGYFYTTAYELPPTWISEHNILALALAVRLASTIPNRGLKQYLQHVIDQIVDNDRNIGKTINFARLSDKISVKNIEYTRVNEHFFRRVVEALLNDLPVTISYHSPHSERTTMRIVQPLHLQLYMGNWHLIAWCAERKALRNFAMSRLLSVASAKERLDVPRNLPSLKEYTRQNFGIMKGEKAQQVTLRFVPHIASRIMEQVWHPKQIMAIEADGSLLLCFPTADFLEVVKVVLGYGADVHVVAPDKLCHLVRQEISKMKKNIDKVII